MKANEAPEKIYIIPRQGGDYSPYWKNDSQDGFGIEYTRTDAFIEKAWEWVDMHFHETEVNDRWGESRYVVMSGHDLFKDDLHKDFRNYMKGE